MQKGEWMEAHQLFCNCLKNQLEHDQVFKLLHSTVSGLLLCEIQLRFSGAKLPDRIIHSKLDLDDISLEASRRKLKSTYTNDVSCIPLPKRQVLIVDNITPQEIFLEAVIDQQSIIIKKDLTKEFIVLYHHPLQHLSPQCFKFLQCMASVKPNSILKSIYSGLYIQEIQQLINEQFLTDAGDSIALEITDEYRALLRSTSSCDNTLLWWAETLASTNNSRCSTQHNDMKWLLFQDLSKISSAVQDCKALQKFWSAVLDFMILTKKWPIQDQIALPTAPNVKISYYVQLIKGMQAPKIIERLELFCRIQLSLEGETGDAEQDRLYALSCLLFGRMQMDPSSNMVSTAHKTLSLCLDKLEGDFKLLAAFYYGRSLFQQDDKKGAKEALQSCYDEWTRKEAPIQDYQILTKVIFYLASTLDNKNDRYQLFQECLIIQFRHHLKLKWIYKTACGLIHSATAPMSYPSDGSILKKLESEYKIEKMLPRAWQDVTLPLEANIKTTATGRGKNPILIEVEIRDKSLIIWHESTDCFAFVIKPIA